VRYLVDKKNSPQTVATARIAPIICQGRPNSVLRVLQILSQ